MDNSSVGSSPLESQPLEKLTPEEAETSSGSVPEQSVAIGPAVWIPRVPAQDMSTETVAEVNKIDVVQNESPPSVAPSQSATGRQAMDDPYQSSHATQSSVHDEVEDVTRHLYESIISGDKDTVSQILQGNPELADLASDGGTRPLHLALDHQRIFLMSLLLHYGANTESEDESGRTALHLAAKNGNLEAAHLLLEAGANLEAISSQGEKPLWIAARANRKHIVQLLLEKQADHESLNVKVRTTALTEAVKSRNVDLVKMLLSQGADVDGIVSRGFSERILGDPSSSEGKKKGASELSSSQPQHRSNKKSSVRQGDTGPQITADYHLHAQEMGERVNVTSSSEILYQSDELYVASDVEPESVRLQAISVTNTSEYDYRSPILEPEVTYHSIPEGQSGDANRTDQQENAPHTHAQKQLTTKTSIINSPAPQRSGDGGKSILYFQDAIGRRYNFPFHLVQTWQVSIATFNLRFTDRSNTNVFGQGMERLINLAFAHNKVLKQRVLEGCYDMEGPDQKIILPTLWQVSVQPGWHVCQRMWSENSIRSREKSTMQNPVGKNTEEQPVSFDYNLKQCHQRPLHEAILHGDPELVRLLLQRGANARLRGVDGRSAHQLAEDTNKEVANVIKYGIPLLGPSISPPDLNKFGNKSTLLRPRAPPRGSLKWLACNSFEATAIQFYPDGKDERDQKSISIHELLYEWKKPQPLFHSRDSGKAPSGFTWYHLPANNVSSPKYSADQMLTANLGTDGMG